MSQVIVDLHARCVRECPLGAHTVWHEINAFRRSVLSHVVKLQNVGLTEVTQWLDENVGSRIIAIPESGPRTPRNARWQPGNWDWCIGQNSAGELVFDYLFLDMTDAVAFKLRWAGA